MSFLRAKTLRPKGWRGSLFTAKNRKLITGKQSRF
jgi:hypothetical protein